MIPVWLIIIPPLLVTLWIAIPALSALLYLYLFLQRRRKPWRQMEPAEQWQLLFLASAFVWSLTSMLLHALPALPLGPRAGEVLIRIVTIANLSLPLTAYGFTVHFLSMPRAIRLIPLGVVAYLLEVILVLAGYVVRNPRVEEGLLYVDIGWGVLFIIPYWVFLMYGSTWFILRERRRVTNRDYRIRLRYLLYTWGALIIGNTANVLFSAYPIDQLFATGAAYLMALNLSQRYPLQLQRAIRRSIILITAALLYIVAFTVVVNVLAHLSQGVSLLASIVVAIVTATLLLSIPPIRQRIVHLVEQYLSNDVDFTTLLYRLSSLGARLRLPQEVGEDILRAITEALPIRQAALILKDELGNVYRPVATVGLSADAQNVTFQADSPLIETLRTFPYALTLEQLTEQPAARGLWVREWEALKALEAEALVPIRTEDKLVGFFVLGPRIDDVPFSQRDLQRWFPHIAQQVAILLDNSRLYAQIQAEADMLARINEELRELNQIKTDLIHNVSHELRTPLTLIIGYADLLRQKFFTSEEELQEAGEIIRQNAQHLLHLVEQLLSFQRLDQAQIALYPFDLAAFLDGVAKAWAPTLEAAGLRLEVNLADDLGYVLGNEDYLRQVLDNLLGNAQKFSPEGGTITLRAWREDSTVYVQVSDQGIGVPPDKLERIFERFYQVDSTAKRQYGGMGIGLALCKEIVERHHGRIWAESEGPGKGLTVSFTLPGVTDASAEKEPSTVENGRTTP